MELAVGSIFQGKVMSITKFGAFVSLPENRTGMVHISEISNTYVSDITKHLQVGQEVSVKVIAIDPEGRINLSIKQTLKPQNERAPQRREARPQKPAEEPVNTFEDKLRKFMQDSESRMSDLKFGAEKRRSTRRGKK